MTAEEILDTIEQLQIRLARRPGSGGGWEWVAFNNAETHVASTVKEAIEKFNKPEKQKGDSSLQGLAKKALSKIFN